LCVPPRPANGQPPKNQQIAMPLPAARGSPFPPITSHT
jgi:hypothetical protein